jgi:hypothetical protein
MTPSKIKASIAFLVAFAEAVRVPRPPRRLQPAPGLKGRDRNKRCIFSGRKLKHLHPRTLEHLYGIAQA